MDKGITSFILNRRLAQVKRYHATPLHQNETVAEHSFYVAIIARVLCGVVPHKPLNILEVVEKALIHDMEEMFTGDIIQPFKYYDPKLKKLIDEINQTMIAKAFDDLPKELANHFKTLWLDYHHNQKIEDKIVKIADKLSLIAYCLEQIQLGNSFMKPILKNGIKLLEEYRFDWLEPIIKDVKIVTKGY